MARVLGVDLPNKRLEIALTYLYGLGPSSAKKIVKELGIEKNVRINDLSEGDMAKLRNILEKDYSLEGDLRVEVKNSIKRLIDINCYRGTRHRSGLPVRGQRTRTNSRTRKGKGKTIANKKIASK